MNIEYKGKVYKVVRETAKMYYITKSKRVLKTSCKVVDTNKIEKPKAKNNKRIVGKKLVKRLEDIKINDKVIISDGKDEIEGVVTTIVRNDNKLGWDPYFNINNNYNVHYVFEGGIKVYKA
jgi:hypothetical protein